MIKGMRMGTILLVGAGALFAQGHHGHGGQGTPGQGAARAAAIAPAGDSAHACCKPGGMGHGMKSGKGGHHGMPEPQLVATQDGGVVLFAGGVLYKYDKNLALKKAEPVVPDTAAMARHMRAMGQAMGAMQGMMENCPVCRGHMHGEGGGPGHGHGAPAKPAAPTPKAPEPKKP